MKPLKKATQRNVVINQDYYTYYQLKDMFDAGEIIVFDEHYDNMKTFPELDYREKEFRIFLADVKDLKIKLDDYGHYTTVAKKNDGKEYYINL